jgi:hypothetical protein
MSLVSHPLITIALAILGISVPFLIAWAVIYADKLNERRFVAEERAKEATRKAARLRRLDAWEQERVRRLAELGISQQHDPSDEESFSRQNPRRPEEPPSQNEGRES